MAAVFLTGFTGSLGSSLVEHLLQRYSPDVPVICLVQIAQRSRAEQLLREIELAIPNAAGRIRLVEGAVTLPDLGLGTGYGRVNNPVTEIYHLVAVDARRKERDLATKVNLIGTQNLLSFAERCPNLTRFHYVSSCRVSGRFAGVFSEADLDQGQSFHNPHEETLFLAEMEVQQYRQNGMPVTIYRPGRITGNSQTGLIAREDALYDLLWWLLSQPSVGVPLLTGNPYRNRLNIVPRDYVAAALAALSGLENSIDKVYHLVDTEPLRIQVFARILGQVTGRRLHPLWVPQPLIRPLLQADPDAFACLYDPTHYTSENTQADLHGSGIYCPLFESYAGKLVDTILVQSAIGR